MKAIFSLALLLALVAVVLSSDPCTNIPTCEECVAQQFCGWCSEFIVYENGKRGRNCAYQGDDALPFFCPKDYQTETCTPELYTCNNVTFQCQPADIMTPNALPIDDCVKSCFPPTFVCNEESGVCEQKDHQGSSFEVCNATCGKEPEELYTCNSETLECEKADNTTGDGTTLDVCEASCGKASNNTPAFTKGVWRGLQVNKGYKEGEWRMTILEDNTILIERPDQSVFAAGTLLQMQNELWIENEVGIMRALFMTTQMPTTLQWVLAIGNAGEIVPNNFDSAMEEGTPSNVFVFYKCLEGSNCDFSSMLKPEIRKRIAAKPMKLSGISDECAKHPDCETCIGDKQNKCGWCDVNVWYQNGTIEGKNCAGHNADGTKDPFICNSVYSTESCVFPTQTDTATDTATADDTQTDEPDEPKYTCNATSATCDEDKSGTFEFLVDCEAQCRKIPDIPIDLIGTWRGLEIREGYVVGEWRAEIDQGKVAIMSPDGKLSIGTNYLVGQYLVLDLQQGPIKGKISTLWQISFSAVTRNLAWAWGEPGKEAPASFNDGLKKPNTEFVMVSCLFGKPVEQCDFTF